MEGAELNLLMSSPWAAVLINDPKWTRATTGSRLPKASGEDSFFAETLATDRTMRACLTLRPTEEADDDLPYKEIVTIVDLGDGVNGYPQTCHGGMVATLMDEVCGVLINLNTERHRDRLIQSGCQDPPAIMSYMTAYLNTTYKRPVPTPGALLCTAKVERQESRKLYVRATIEDGAAGTVYTTGEALFIRVKPRL